MIFPFSVSRWSYHSPLNIQPPGSYRADADAGIEAIGRDFSACVTCVRQIAVCFGLYLLTSLDIQTCGEIHSSVPSNMLCLVQMGRAGNLSLACTTPHCSFWSRLKSWTCQQFNPIFLNANEPNQIKPHGSQFNSKILRPNGWYNGSMLKPAHLQGLIPKKVSIYWDQDRRAMAARGRCWRHFMNF